MPDLVAYDCTVSLAGDERIVPTTAAMMVYLEDGLENMGAGVLEGFLANAVIRRLKVVVTMTPLVNTVTPGLETHIVDVCAPSGYRLGRIKAVIPHRTDWISQPVDLTQTFVPGEAEAYIEGALRKQLRVKVNQRTPPLPRTKPDVVTGQRPDYVMSIDPSGNPYRVTVEDDRSSSVISESSRTWQLQDDGEWRFVREVEEGIERFRETELYQQAQRDLDRHMVENPWEYAWPQNQLRKLRSHVAPTPTPTPTPVPHDVARRSEDSSRLDTAYRGGTQGQDVATMGEELDL